MVGGDEPPAGHPVNPPPSFADRILIIHNALARAGVDHGFGGAVALAYYIREPRATRDIDLNIAVDIERAGTVLAVMPEGVEVSIDAAEVIARDGQIRLWWDGRTGVPVDLFFPQHPFHREVARDTRPVPFLDGAIPIISATHLTVFKSLFNRPRDWPDIAAMLEAGTVNVTAALGWVRRLLGEEAAPYVKLAALSREAAAGALEPPGSEMDIPAVDWQSLGGK
jgi:hypothetical protein